MRTEPFEVLIVDFIHLCRKINNEIFGEEKIILTFPL